MFDSFEIFDLVDEAVIVRDVDGRVKAWNAAAERLYGYSRGVALGQSADTILKSEYAIPIADIVAGCIAVGHWEGQVKRKSATEGHLLVHVRLSVRYDLVGAPAYLVETGRDLSELANFAEALRTSEQRYQNLFQAMAISFFEMDFSGVGKVIRRLRSSGVSDFRSYLQASPDTIREFMQATRVVNANDRSVALFGRGNKEELLGTIEPLWPEESWPAYIDAIISSLDHKPSFAAETRLRRFDGTVFDAHFTVWISPANRSEALAGVLDITERNRAQEMLQRVQSDFAHAARISMLGELTASIAHEVNQPLASIAANADAGLHWLETADPKIDKARDSIKWIVEDARRAADVIARIRSMAEHRAPERSLVSLDDIIRQALGFIRHELRAHAVQVAHDSSPDTPLVFADRTQLQQVIVNLAINAMQAIVESDSHRREITIRTEIVGRADVCCTFEDSGPGIRPDNLAHLFDSFFTTKPRGMGMGLPICRSIVEAHGGHIRAENIAMSGGARLSFILPAPNGEFAHAPFAAPPLYQQLETTKAPKGPTDKASSVAPMPGRRRRQKELPRA
jgi:PAS domain S-box-containing protein